MPKTTKKTRQKDIIEQIEANRGSKAIVYFTGEKNPLEQFGTQVAIDILPLFRDVLENIGKNINKISLILNTSGGSLEVPWPLVNLIREYCKTFEVIVLEKALSAGTLISLGADKIVMLPYSSLSPVDPAANFIDGEKKQVKRLEIEDIIGYIDFAKQKVGIAEQNALADIMKELSKEISPTMLGSVNRTHSLIRRLAKNLLFLHKNSISEKQVKEITENLTQNLFSHRHLINRREAKNIIGFGNIIEFAGENTKNIASNIHKYCSDILQIDKDFDPGAIIGSNNEINYSLPRALIYSTAIKYKFISSYKIVKTPDPSGKPQILINNFENKWKK